MMKNMQKKRLYCFMCSDKDNFFILLSWVSRINSETRTCFMNRKMLWTKYLVDWCVCPLSILYFICWIVLSLFSSCSVDHYLFQSLCLSYLIFWPCNFLLKVWMYYMTDLSDSKAVMTFFMPLPVFFNGRDMMQKQSPLFWPKQLLIQQTNSQFFYTS